MYFIPTGTERLEILFLAIIASLPVLLGLSWRNAYQRLSHFKPIGGYLVEIIRDYLKIELNAKLKKTIVMQKEVYLDDKP